MKRILAALALAGLATACGVGGEDGSSAEAFQSGSLQSYLVVAVGSLPADIQQKIIDAGGSVTRSHPEVGILVASSSSGDFRAKVAKMPGVRSVIPDRTFEMLDPSATIVDLDSATADAALTAITDIQLPLLWGMQAIHAPDAWAAGRTGAGVRVAVLDTGIWADHPDLNPNVNRALSVSLIPGEDWLQPAMLPLEAYHGTHVAGTIAAAINGAGVVGVAPSAELVAVKVLGNTGAGSFGDVLRGILYATDIQADIVNMSLGVNLLRSGFCTVDGCVSAKDVSELWVVFDRVVSYARQHGVTVISSAGNSHIDFDHSGDLIRLPASAPGVVSISATAPVGWAVGGTTNLDHPASYSNYGQSLVSFAAPGGDFIYPGNENCLVAGIVRPCWVFDLVFSTVRQPSGQAGFAWMAGTSMAAPHAAGVAALIIADAGGTLSPAAVEAALRAGADDLGKPGNDDFYGAGRVRAQGP